LLSSTSIKFVMLFALLILGLALSMLYGGSEPVGSAHPFIFWQIRVPKTITALLAGSTLAVSGLILQVIFRNPLAGPYVLGISSGAALMVAVTVLAGGSTALFSSLAAGKTLLVFSAITGSLLVTLLILFVSVKVSSNIVLLLIGLMFSQICAAVQMALEYFSEANHLKSFVIWGMGSLANTTTQDIYLYAPIAVVCLLAFIFFIKPLNALLLGEDYARNAGVDFRKNRFILVLIASVLTGVTTAFCGPIAFIGTAVPILSRMIFRTSRQEVHYVSCALIGCIILLVSDYACNNLMKNVVLPVNMLTTFIGAPVVIYLMFRNKQW
jgi:iron complex transport system permease protein